MRALHLIIVACFLSLTLTSVASADSATLTIPALRESDVLVLSLKAGDVVDVTWSATAIVEFHVDLFNGAEVFSQSSQVGRASVTIPLDGTYSFTFRNRNLSDVVVTWSINKRADLAIIAVSVVAVALIALAAIAFFRVRRRPQWPGQKPPQQPPMPPTP